MLTDFPGLYNLHAQSEDGKVTEEAMLDTNHENHPDFVLMVADASSLQGSFFWCCRFVNWAFHACCC